MLSPVEGYGIISGLDRSILTSCWSRPMNFFSCINKTSKWEKPKANLRYQHFALSWKISCKFNKKNQADTHKNSIFIQYYRADHRIIYTISKVRYLNFNFSLILLRKTILLFASWWYHQIIVMQSLLVYEVNRIWCNLCIA